MFVGKAKKHMNFQKSGAVVTLLTLSLMSLAWGGTFGTPVPIGGHAADIALDEGRGVLYIANFTANRVDVMSLSDNTVHSSFNTAPQPGSLGLSPDGRYLVAGHFVMGQLCSPPVGALTVIDLQTNRRQTFGLDSPALGVAFGVDGQALVVTTKDFLTFDPVSGVTQVIDTLTGVAAKAFPDKLATFPSQIVASSLAGTRDNRMVFGVIDIEPNKEGADQSGSASGTNTCSNTQQTSGASSSGSSSSSGNESKFVRFSYNVSKRQIVGVGTTSSPKLGPRAVSVAADGSYYMAGWALIGCNAGPLTPCDASGPLIAEIPNANGALNIGSNAIDSVAGIIYAQVPEAGSTESPSKPNSVPRPVLMIMDADNLTVRERILLPENLAGRSLLNEARNVMYSISDSGVMVLPVGSLNRVPRVAASQEDVVFRGNFCDRSVVAQEITISNPGGGETPFVLSTAMKGVTISPSYGVTPATVQIMVDPNVYQNQKGTMVGQIEIRSAAAVNMPDPIRVLVNNREPDQRGTFVNVPGKLVDLLADTVRNRFYVLRQDKNQVLVFDGTNYSQIAALRTSNVPTQMAMTFDRRYLLVGHNDSQLAYVFDLETLQPDMPIRFPGGHYPRSLAASGKTILAASRVAGPDHTIDRVDFLTRSATQLPMLGIYKNSVHINTVLQATPNGSAVLAAMPDGNLMLYDANADTFTISRRDFKELSGAYAASNFGHFVVGDNMLNSSLVLMRKLPLSSDASSGFIFVDQSGIQASAQKEGGGMIQRVNMAQSEGILATRMVEAPMQGGGGYAFSRTLAPIADRSAFVAMTTSGFTVLPWNYDAAVAPPRLERVVNAADFSRPVAPGGLISVFGNDLSPVNIASQQIPLPTALGESCLTVNGVGVPMLFVSSRQINAQLPFNVDGNATMVLRTPGGVSDNLNLVIRSNAPSVFRSGVAGPDTGIPTVVRARNNELVTPANPIHPDDRITIYLTGMGRTSISVETGMPAPSDQLATVMVQPTVSLGSVSLPIVYAGLAPGLVGVYQIDAIVPFRGIPTGFDVPLSISQGGASTTFTVRVVD